MTSGRHTVQQFKEAPAPTRATPAKSVARTNNQPSPTSPTTEKKRARTPAEPKPTPVPHSEWDERPDLSNTAGPYGHAPVLHIVSNKSFVVPDTSEGWDAAAGVVFDVATTVFGPAKLLGLGAKAARGAGALAKVELNIGSHAAKQMAEREISKSMIKVALEKGTPFIDPKNGTINYVLKGGFASGKDLLVGTNPLTGKITTVIRGWNLIASRFIPYTP